MNTTKWTHEDYRTKDDPGAEFWTAEVNGWSIVITVTADGFEWEALHGPDGYSHGVAPTLAEAQAAAVPTI